MKEYISMNYRTFFFCTILSGLALLTGCDDKKPKVQETSAQQKAEDIEQQEILKYNAYVDTANYQPYNKNFSDEVNRHEEYIADYINKNKKITSYSTVDKTTIAGKKERIEKALAIKASISDLDASAEKYLNALNALIPINDELSLYADTKEYLSDDGKLFREKEPQLLALLKATATAEDDFDNKITEHDTVLIKKQFESQDKDTFMYYRNGIIYYEKVIVHEIAGLIEKNDTLALAKLNEDADTLNTLFKGYLKTKQANNSTCEYDIKSFISTTRDMSQKMKNSWDEYTKVDPHIRATYGHMNLPASTAESHYENLLRHFSSLIGNMNADRC
jgi:hypothetical protein